MTRTGWIWALVAVVVIIAAALLLMRPNTSAPTDTGAVTNNETNTSTDTGTLTGTVTTDLGADTAKTVTVTYNGTAFSPARVTINRGDTVSFVNQGSRGFWVASDEHPAHTLYDGTSRSEHCAAGYTGAKPFDACSTGNSYSYTFEKAGTFEYHDHVNAAARGTVVVQ